MQKIKRDFTKLAKRGYAGKVLITVLLYSRVMILLGNLILLRLNGILKRKRVILIALYEHIGDIVACEPVISYLHSENSDSFFIWALHKPYAELISMHPRINRILKLTYFSEWILLRKMISLFPVVDKIVDLHINDHSCKTFKKKIKKPENGINLENYLIDKSLLQAFLLSASLPELKTDPVFYLDKSRQIENLPHEYIVLHTNSNMRIKEWDSEKWEQLCSQLMQLNYYVFEIGLQKRITLNSGQYVDYTGIKSLQEIANLICSCKLFIGIDSGFAHIANALHKEGLVLIGRFKRGNISVNRYNPFTGKYAQSANIIYAREDFVASIPFETVMERAKEKLFHHNSTIVLSDNF